MAITGPLLPGTAYADPAGDTVSTLSANTAQDTIPAQHQSGRKQILNDEPKGLSGFFIIGIAINLFMALAFAWWFFLEWRRPRK